MEEVIGVTSGSPEGHHDRRLALGLDVSTSVVGIALVDVETGGTVWLGSADLRKVKGSIHVKARDVERTLVMLRDKHNITSCFIEENLMAFRPGRSSAATLNALARFNGIVADVAARVFGTDTVSIDCSAARRALGIKLQRESVCGKSAKEQVFSALGDKIGWEWKTKRIKSGPRAGMDVFDVTQYDSLDAYVVVRAALKDPALLEPKKKAKKKAKSPNRDDQ